VAERSFAHTGSAVTEFAEWLSELAGDPGCVAIAIEIPRGAVVETLVERASMSTPSIPSSSIGSATGTT